MLNTVEQKQVAYEQVQSGDFLYNKDGYCQSAKWVRVINVTRNGDEIAVHTTVYSQYGHAKEGVTIRREVTS